MFSITIVLWSSSDFSSLVYFIILGCIGGMGILLGICIVVRYSVFPTSCVYLLCQIGIHLNDLFIVLSEKFLSVFQHYFQLQIYLKFVAVKC